MPDGVELVREVGCRAPGWRDPVVPTQKVRLVDVLGHLAEIIGGTTHSQPWRWRHGGLGTRSEEGCPWLLRLGRLLPGFVRIDWSTKDYSAHPAKVRPRRGIDQFGS